MRWIHRSVLWQLLLVLVTALACAAPTSPAAPAGQPASQPNQPAQPAQNRPRGSITIAVSYEPDMLGAKSTGGEGGSEARWLVNSPLTSYQMDGNLRPLLAERVPSRDNGDWVINADGSMVTTYHLRKNLKWHDGTPITAHDLVFAYQVYIDGSLPFRNEFERRMSSVEATDDHTLVINWPQPFIYANAIGFQELGPLPRHKMEEKFRTDKANFDKGDEWTTAYMGSGPYRLDRWEAGSRILFRVFNDWFLGPPRIETIEVRFIGDANAVLANILSGTIDFTSTPPLRINEAIIARDQWAQNGQVGYVKNWDRRIRYLEFQYREVPNWQRLALDPRIRRAVMHAIDRPALATVMTSGFGQVADVWALPSDPIYEESVRLSAKYPYDPNRAVALLAEAGWTRQGTGLLTNAAGQTLDLEVNSGSSEPQVPTIIADAWKAVGISSTIDQVPNALLNDVRARSTFSFARVGQRGPDMDGFHFVSSKIPQPPRFNEANYGSFSDPEVDRLWNITQTNLDQNERRQAAIAVNQRLNELTAYVPLYYQAEVLVAKARLKGPTGPAYTQAGITWNVYEWEVTD